VGVDLDLVTLPLLRNLSSKAFTSEFQFYGFSFCRGAQITYDAHEICEADFSTNAEIEALKQRQPDAL
jgi:hypothetical protein